MSAASSSGGPGGRSGPLARVRAERRRGTCPEAEAAKELNVVALLDVDGPNRGYGEVQCDVVRDLRWVVGETPGDSDNKCGGRDVGGKDVGVDGSAGGAVCVP